MFPILQIGPLSLPAPELMVVLSFYLALYVTERTLRWLGKNPDEYSNMLLIGVLIFIIIGRVGYVFSHLFAFTGNPMDIFSLNRDLFDPWVGLLGMLLFSWITLQKRKLDPLTALDDLAIFIIILLLGFGMADLASGNSFGIASNLPWAIELWGMQRHPVQIYQVVLLLLVLLILLGSLRKNGTNRGAFTRMVLFVSASSIFLEAFRAEGSFLPGGFRTAQILWWLIFVGVYWYNLQQSSKNTTN